MAKTNKKRDSRKRGFEWLRALTRRIKRNALDRRWRTAVRLQGVYNGYPTFLLAAMERHSRPIAQAASAIQRFKTKLDQCEAMLRFGFRERSLDMLSASSRAMICLLKDLEDQSRLDDENSLNTDFGERLRPLPSRSERLKARMARQKVLAIKGRREFAAGVVHAYNQESDSPDVAWRKETLHGDQSDLSDFYIVNKRQLNRNSMNRNLGLLPSPSTGFPGILTRCAKVVEGDIKDCSNPNI